MEKVTVIVNHMNEKMRVVGEEYETTKQHAGQLKAAGLVEWDGEPAEAQKGTPVLVKDTPPANDDTSKEDPKGTEPGKGGAIKPVATITTKGKDK